MGRAWTVLVGIGKVSSFEEIKGNISLGQAAIPNKERSVIYKEIYERYEQLAKDVSKYF